MTDTPNKDFNPKHRVVGAIVLVALAVVVVPWVLDSGEDDWHSGDGASATENKVFVTELTDTAASAGATHTAPAAQTAPAAIAPPPATASASPTPAPTPAKVDEAAASVPPSVPARAPAVPAEKGFYVQVGAFSDRANAKHLADQLRQHGYRVRVEQVRVASRNVLRVRVGPYSQNKQAQAARAAIQRQFDVQGIVRAY